MSDRICAVVCRASPQHEQVYAAWTVRFICHQQIQRDSGQIVCDCIRLRIVLSIKEFQIGMAFTAGLGFCPASIPLYAEIRESSGRAAVCAYEPRYIPLGGAERTGEVPQLPLSEDDAGDRRRAADRTGIGKRTA